LIDDGVTGFLRPNDRGSRMNGDAGPRPDPEVQTRVGAFIAEQYAAGPSLREPAELTDRSLSAIRNIIDRHGVHRRGSGAAALREPSA
jgi:hypothetical protein